MQPFMTVKFHDDNRTTEREFVEPCDPLFDLFYNKQQAIVDLSEKFDADTIEKFRPRDVFMEEEPVILDPYEAMKFWKPVWTFMERKIDTFDTINRDTLKTYHWICFTLGEITCHIEYARKNKLKIEFVFIPN